MLKKIALTLAIVIGLSTLTIAPAHAMRPEGQYYRPKDNVNCVWSPCAENRWPGRVNLMQSLIDQLRKPASANVKQQEQMYLLQKTFDDIKRAMDLMNNALKSQVQSPCGCQ